MRESGTPIILYGRLYTQYETRIKEVDTFATEGYGSMFSVGNEVIVPASGETAEDIAVASSVRSAGIILGGDLNIVRPDRRVDQDFLALGITYGRTHRELSKRAQGKSVVHLHGTDIAEVDFAFPSREEQSAIASAILAFDDLIALHQRKLDHLKLQKRGLLQKMFPKNGANVPEARFPGFTDPWEQRKLGDEFRRVNERNDGSFGRDHWISVARMYFQDPEMVQSNNLDTRTYVMREGDIAFEGHPNAEFAYGRFVVNDIGDGIVSELFPVYRHVSSYDCDYWKYAIQIERTMGPIFAKSITSSGNSSNKLNPTHFLKQRIRVPSLPEQRAIGAFFRELDDLITLHQRKLDHLKLQKKALLQQMFV